MIPLGKPTASSIHHMVCMHIQVVQNYQDLNTELIHPHNDHPKSVGSHFITKFWTSPMPHSCAKAHQLLRLPGLEKAHNKAGEVPKATFNPLPNLLQVAWELKNTTLPVLNHAEAGADLETEGGLGNHQCLSPSLFQVINTPHLFVKWL